jgi:hypothetical protein
LLDISVHLFVFPRLSSIPWPKPCCLKPVNTLSTSLAILSSSLHVAKQPNIWCCCNDFWFSDMRSCLFWGLNTYKVHWGWSNNRTQTPIE